MSNDNIDQIIEDVEEKDLVENQELEVVEETEEVVVEETAEEVVSEEIEVTEDEQPLADTVLEVLLGEKTIKKSKADIEKDNQYIAVNDDTEEDSKDEDSEEEEEVKEEKEDDVEENTSDDTEDAIDANSKDTEDSVKKIGKLDAMPEVTTKAGYLAASFGKLKEMRKSALVNAYSALNPIKEGEEEEVAETPKLKADLINAMYGQLQNMKKDDMVASYQKIMSAYKEDVNEEVEADNFAQDLKVLAEADQELTEDFKAKASILFEGAVANKVSDIKESLESQYAEDLQEEVAYVRDTLVEKIDSYLSHVVESWIEENQEFVDNKLRTEIAENFMKALQNTFTEHYIEVPDSKVDVVDELAEQATIAKQELASAIEEKAELSRQVEELSREKIIAEASGDLASTQAGKLAKLLEEVDFVDSDTFAEKVVTIKEGFFKDSESTEDETLVENTKGEVETIVEGEVNAETKLPADMAKYVKHLSRFNNSIHNR